MLGQGATGWRLPLGARGSRRGSLRAHSAVDIEVFEFELQLVNLMLQLLGLLAKHHTLQLGQQEFETSDLFGIVALVLLERFALGIPLRTQHSGLIPLRKQQRLQGVDVVGEGGTRLHTCHSIDGLGTREYGSCLDLRRPGGALRVTPVDAFEQHRQLRSRQRHTPVLGGLGPHEASRLQTLAEQAHPVAIEPQHLDAITAAATEHEHVPTERIRLQAYLYLGRQAVEPAAHVGHARYDPDARVGRQ